MGGISFSPLHLSFFQIPSPSQKIYCLSREYTQSTIKRPFGEQVKLSSKRITWTIPMWPESILPYNFSKTKSPRVLNFHTYTIILRLARDISSSSRGFPASCLRKLGPTWTSLFASITSQGSRYLQSLGGMEGRHHWWCGRKPAVRALSRQRQQQDGGCPFSTATPEELYRDVYGRLYICLLSLRSWPYESPGRYLDRLARHYRLGARWLRSYRMG